MYVHGYDSVPSCLLTCMSLCPCEAVIRRERYLIILCSPIQVIQMIWTLRIGAELTFAIFCRLSVYWKKDNLTYWTHSPWRANCYGNEHHTLSELQCPLSCRSGGWKRIWPTLWHTHAHAYSTHRQNEGGEMKEKQKRGEQTCISRPHKPVNKICGADKL